MDAILNAIGRILRASNQEVKWCHCLVTLLWGTETGIGFFLREGLIFEIERQIRRKLDYLKYMLQIEMTKLADGLGGRMREREKEKVIPGFVYLFSGIE